MKFGVLDLAERSKYLGGRFPELLTPRDVRHRMRASVLPLYVDGKLVPQLGTTTDV